MDVGMGDASWNETGERDYRDYSPTEFEEHPETLFNAGRHSWLIESWRPDAFSRYSRGDFTIETGMPPPSSIMMLWEHVTSCNTCRVLKVWIAVSLLYSWMGIHIRRSGDSWHGQAGRWGWGGRRWRGGGRGRGRAGEEASESTSVFVLLAETYLLSSAMHADKKPSEHRTERDLRAEINIS